MNHTPGPWLSIVPPSCLLTTRKIKTEDGEHIADIGIPGEGGVGTIQNVANARLIAAAPELLEAAESLMDILREMPKGPQHDAMVILHGVIEKAKGGK